MKDNQFQSRPRYLSLCVCTCVVGTDKIFPVIIKQHTKVTNGEMEVQRHSFLSLALDWCMWSAKPWSLYPRCKRHRKPIKQDAESSLAWTLRRRGRFHAPTGNRTKFLDCPAYCPVSISPRHPDCLRNSSNQLVSIIRTRLICFFKSILKGLLVSVPLPLPHAP